MHTFTTPKQFLANIRKHVIENNVSYIDAILDYCLKNGLDEEVAGTMIRSLPSLKKKLLAEAVKLRLVNEK